MKPKHLQLLGPDPFTQWKPSLPSKSCTNKEEIIINILTFSRVPKSLSKHLPVSIIFSQLMILENCKNSRGEDSPDICHRVWLVIFRTDGRFVSVLTKHKIGPEFNPQNVVLVYIRVLCSVFPAILNIILANQQHRYDSVLYHNLVKICPKSSMLSSCNSRANIYELIWGPSY